MSEALRSAVATAPSEWNVEALAERLIALRTEIDTILAGIEAQRTKTLAQAQTEPAEADSLVEPAPVAAIAAPGKPIEIAAASRATIEDQASTEKASDATERETDDAEEISREAETRSNATSDEARELDTAAPVAAAVTEERRSAAIDIDVSHDQAGAADAQNSSEEPPVLAAATASAEPTAVAATTDAPTAEAQAEPKAETSMAAPEQIMLEPARAASEIEATPTGAATETGPSAATSTEAPALLAADAAPAANIISLDRARRQKGDVAAMPSRGRTGRRLATRVAACILALLTAATLLAVADRVAQSGVPQPPWLPQLPTYSPSGAASLLLRQMPSATPSRAAVGAEAPAARLPAPEELYLKRYLEVWPSGS